MKYSFSLLAVSAAVFASPLGVTKAIAPSGSAPAGCSPTFPGSFGLAVSNIGNRISGRQAVSQISDGQVQAPTSTKVATTSSARVVTQISDGQIQAPTSATAVKTSTSVKSSSSSKVSSISLTIVPVISQISDGQIQNPRPAPSSSARTTSTSPAVVPPTTKPTTSSKATTSTAKTSSASANTKPNTSSVTSSKPTSSAKSSSSSKPASSSKAASSKAASSKPASSKPASSRVSSSKLATSVPTSSRTLVTPVSVISDGQPQAPTVTTIPDGQVNVSPNGLGACATNGTLTLTLSNGVLKDARGWTGYIASNRQFQFDNPPQSGAIYTSGFTVCSNGSLALGGSAVFWECLSGGFYNLYDQWIAPQCSPITLNVARLVKC